MADSVFSPVIQMSSDDLTEAAYQMQLLFGRRQLLSEHNISISEFLEAFSAFTGRPITAPLREAIEQSVENIEQEEGQPLPLIEEERMARYSKELTGLVLNRAYDAASSGIQDTHAACSSRPSLMPSRGAA